jgi:hypothetical protein
MKPKSVDLPYLTCHSGGSRSDSDGGVGSLP